MTPELSFDGGTTWVPTVFYQPTLGVIIRSAASNGSYAILCSGGASNARVRASAFSSGSITASLRAGARHPVAVVTAGSDGANIHSLLTDTSGRLVLAGSSGANITTAATTAVKATAGVLPPPPRGTRAARAHNKPFHFGVPRVDRAPASP